MPTLENNGKQPTSLMRYISTIESDLRKAKSLNPKNPRAHFLLGQSYLNKPSFIGGSKSTALYHFKKARQLFEQQSENQSQFYPTWGDWQNEEGWAPRRRRMPGAKARSGPVAVLRPGGWTCDGSRQSSHHRQRTCAATGRSTRAHDAHEPACDCHPGSHLSTGSHDWRELPHSFYFRRRTSQSLVKTRTGIWIPHT